MNIKEIQNQKVEQALKTIRGEISFLIDMAYSQGKIDVLTDISGKNIKAERLDNYENRKVIK